MFIRLLNVKWLNDIIIFTVIIISFHFIYLFFLPQLNGLELFNIVLIKLTDLVLIETSWFIDTFLYNISIDGRTMYFENNRFVEISSGCSGLKPTLQLIVLFVFFPGPVKKKIWYIPMGIVILHLINIFRIISLAIIIMEYPRIWIFAHDWVFRPFFYIAIFVLWWIWNDIIRPKVKLEN